MQELTFEQVEHVSGGLTQGPFIVNNYYDINTQKKDEKPEATGGSTIVGGTIGGTNLFGSVIIGKLSVSAGVGVGVVGFVASQAYSATQEGRDNMRVQNHPATRHLYNADGTKK